MNYKKRKKFEKKEKKRDTYRGREVVKMKK